LKKTSSFKLKAELEQAAAAEAFLESTLNPNKSIAVDWKSCRIPVEIRKRAVGVFYMAQLKKHVREEKKFFNAVRTALRDERDLRHFLNDNMGLKDSDGHDPGSIQTQMPKPSPATPPVPAAPSHPYWYASEETRLTLIGICAKGLVHAAPFEIHPANQDPTRNAAARRFGLPTGLQGSPTAASRSSSSLHATSSREDVEFYISRNLVSQLARLERRPPESDPSRARSRPSSRADDRGPESPPPGESGGRQGGNVEGGDVEELFRNFTPRLREMSEEQNQKEAASRAAETVAHAGGAGAEDTGHHAAP
jgi:hypothetical protein